MGNQALEDSMVSDGLIDKFNDYHMGIAENLVEKYGISREEQDQSQPNHNKGGGACTKKLVDLTLKLYRFEVPQRKGDLSLFLQDEGIRQGTTADKLGKLRPAF